MRRDLVGALAEARRRELVEDGGRRRARDRVAAERPAEAAGVHRVHDVGLAGDGGERQAAAERLPGDEQVGLDAEALDRPERARPSAPGLHLVVDVEDAVRVAALLQRDDELGRHRDEAAFALHRLEHDARDLSRIDVLLEEEVEPGERVLRRDAAVRIRRRRAVDVGGERPEALLVHELRRHRHRQRRAPVEGAVEDDDARAVRWRRARS